MSNGEHYFDKEHRYLIVNFKSSIDSSDHVGEHVGIYTLHNAIVSLLISNIDDYIAKAVGEV